MSRIDFIPTKRRDRTTKDGRHYPHPDNGREARAIAAAYTGGMHDGPVGVSIDTYGKLPKGAPKRVASEPNDHKPDIDNTAKAILDALNGIAYRDDRFVTSLHVRKHDRERREGEYTEFEVYDAEEEP